ncbi:MAG: hypothetical protein HUJ53_02290 [Holdemanella sp.]|nr:hypothetical protein [Holdemanella sp.]
MKKTTIIHSMYSLTSRMWFINNKTGKVKFETLVDYYRFLTLGQTQYKVGNTVGILDENCNVIIESNEFEDITKPMKGLFFAKKMENGM